MKLSKIITSVSINFVKIDSKIEKKKRVFKEKDFNTRLRTIEHCPKANENPKVLSTADVFLQWALMHSSKNYCHGF